MTQDEVIEMAREAGFFIIANSPDLFSKLVAFAKLVAAKERERIIEANAPELEKVNAHIKRLEEQEPVAWGVFGNNLHDMFFTEEEAQEMARLKGDGSVVKPLYTKEKNI